MKILRNGVVDIPEGYFPVVLDEEELRSIETALSEWIEDKNIDVPFDNPAYVVYCAMKKIRAVRSVAESKSMFKSNVFALHEVYKDIGDMGGGEG